MAGRLHPGRGRALLAFTAFGLFWGTWGALLPAVQARADAGDGEIGVALLGIGAGALACMRLAGAAVDRWGSRVLPLSLALFAASAALPGAARSPLALSGALLVLGGASGALDVAMNTEAVRAEALGRRVLNLAHAAFSGAVVGGSLITGALRTAGAAPQTVLAGVAGLLVLTAVAMAALAPAPAAARQARTSARRRLRVPAPLAVLGGLAALAYLVENAWQSWSALHLERTLDARPAVSALGPAIFAGAVVIGRLAGHGLTERAGERATLRAGAIVAAAGTLGAAVAPAPPVALAAIAVAGLGTSVCAPTLISLAGRTATQEQQGASVSIVITLAYLGFLVGPALVGIVSDVTELPVALATVGGVALLLAALAGFAPMGPPARPRRAPP